MGGDGVIKENLETGEGIQGRLFDTLIFTQTLMFTYELQEVAKNIHAILRDGGYALIAVSGISQISRYDANNWGSFFCFHEDAMKRLFIPLFGEQNVSVECYGNVKTAAAMLYGLCCEGLDKSDFEKNDEDYPNIIAVLLHKSNA